MKFKKSILGLEKFWKSNIILFDESLDKGVIFNQILNFGRGLCVYHIVLLTLSKWLHIGESRLHCKGAASR